MPLSAVSVLVVAQSSSEIPEGLMNNPVLCSTSPDHSCQTGLAVKRLLAIPLAEAFVHWCIKFG